VKPARFEFHNSRTVSEVLTAIAQYEDDYRILAGGQSLVPLMNLRMIQPRAIISINQCPELDYIRDIGDAIEIGAATRQIDVETSPLIARHVALLAKCLPHVGGLSNRNRGTVCGSLAHADPLAELPAVAMALDAIFVIRSMKGSREVSAANFFVSELTTVVKPGEMLERVRFPKQPASARTAFLETGNRRHGFAIAGVAAQIELVDGVCASARIAAMGVGPTAVRLREVEKMYVGEAVTGLLMEEAAAIAAKSVDPSGDIHADAPYRKRLLGVLVKRATSATMALN
jgi:carbon-monoxide dehydrogenase medium subunit